MAIIKQYHKDTDTTYVYESISYWDDEKKQSRSKRRVIGKLDPETGEIIPTGKRGRKRKEDTEPLQAGESENSELRQLYEESQSTIRKLKQELEEQDKAIKALAAERDRLSGIISRSRQYLEQCAVLLEGVSENR